MNKINLTKIFILSLLFAVVSISAQIKPQTLKFDEFEISNPQFHSLYREITVAQRAERFAKHLRKQTGVKAYIIYYQARIIENNSGIRYLADSIKSGVSNERLAYDDVVVVDGGFRENDAFEFWIVPKNADLPAPTPTFAKSETFQCANLSVYGYPALNKTDEVIFSVNSYDLKVIENPTLTWKVSAGEMVEGQGKDSIKVKLNDSTQKRVTAFLEIEGLPYPCPKVFTGTAEIRGKLFLIDSFGNIPNGETKARLDAFLSTMQDNPTAKGYVIIYGSRASGARSIESKNRLYTSYFTFRNVDVSRITIMNGGYREQTSGELWLAFGDEKPVPAPTVDRQFVEVPKPARKPRPRRK